MTGQHTGHTPVRGNGARGTRPDGSDPRALELDAYTIPKMFNVAGYQNGMFGKWGAEFHSLPFRQKDHDCLKRQSS